jgi:flagellar motility protein MotE (MotC chaperone)
MTNGYDQFFKEAKKAKAAPSSSSAKSSKGTRAKKAMSPEDQVRAELSRRMQSRQGALMKRRKQAGMPVFPAIVLSVCFLAGLTAYFQPDSVDLLLRHVDIGLFGSANAETARADSAKPKSKSASSADAAKPTATTGQGEENAAPQSTVAKEGDVPDVKHWSEEELSFFKKLNERKKELDLREADLKKLEDELQKQRGELDEKIKALESMRNDISKTLKVRVAADQEKVDKLVNFYSTMKPTQAAKVIEALNEDLAVEVLDKMKKKNAAEILDAMDSKRARRLSELMTGYERTPAALKNDEADDSAVTNKQQ